MVMGLSILVTGFLILMISIGLDPFKQYTTRITGLALLSLGTALTIFGSVWCLCTSYENSSKGHVIHERDAESQTLTEMDIDEIT